MADAHANFAVSNVAVAPSTPSAGLTLDVTTGHGTRFATPPFNATVWPAGVQPDPTNATIIRVTGIAGDTLTFLRIQEGSANRSIGVGDQIEAGITVKTLTDVEAAMPYKGAFSTAASYNVNDVVIYHNKLYVCTTAVTPAASSFVGATTALNLQGGGTIALPAGSAVGDLVVITICNYTGGGSNKPSYATLIGTPSNGVNTTNLSYYALASGDITAGTLTIPAQTGPNSAAMLHVFHNVARGIDTAGVGGNASLTTPVVTPADACFLLELGTQVNSSGTGLLTASWAPSGYVSASNGGGNTADVAGGYETLAAGVSSTARTFVNPVGTTSGSTASAVPVLTGSAFNIANWTKIAEISEYLTAVTASGAAQTIPDPSLNEDNRIVLTANCTFTFPTAAAGKRLRIALVQDATGSRTATWPGTVKWSGGTAPTLTTTANKTDVFEFTCYDGTNWIGQTLGLNY